MTALRPEWESIESNMRTGINWLTKTDQPDGAGVTHHGLGTHVGGHLYVAFHPGGWHPDYAPNSGYVSFKLRNPDSRIYAGSPDPFTQEECEALVDLAKRWGAEVDSTWNGAPFDSFSIGITNVSASLDRAEKNYQNGCPDHDTVFCGEGYNRGYHHGDPDDEDYGTCTWWEEIRGRLVEPTWIDTPRPEIGQEPETEDSKNLRQVLRALEKVRPILAEAGFHPDTIVAGRRGDIEEDGQNLYFETKAGHGVCLPAEAIVSIVELLDGVGLL